MTNIVDTQKFFQGRGSLPVHLRHKLGYVRTYMAYGGTLVAGAIAGLTLVNMITTNGKDESSPVHGA
ncbi:hypothetical protein MP638_005030 [Amoeboaphelidium occidentale]|nr:hypothetical protein MP638_005030 [Amoeboaphelidium occidentale]